MAPTQFLENSKVCKKYSNDKFGGFGDGQGTFRIRRRCYEEKQVQQHQDEDKSLSKPKAALPSGSTVE